MEINGVDRTDDTLLGWSYTRQIEQVGTASVTCVSAEASWRPEYLQTIAIWSDWRVVTDAAMTLADRTLTSATAAFDAEDVGTHVRLDGAGPLGLPLLAGIVGVTSSTEVELDVEADLTVVGATALIGIARFQGAIVSVNEARVLANPTARQYDLACQDGWGAMTSLFPRLSRPAESLADRLAALIRESGALAHGVRAYQPVSSEHLPLTLYSASDLELYAGGSLSLYNTSGSEVAAATYVGATSLTDVIRALVTEDRLQRVVSIDGLGRLRADVPTMIALPQAFTSADILVDVGTSRQQVDYANRVVWEWGDTPSYEVVEDLPELGGLASTAALDLYAGDSLSLYAGGSLDLYTNAQSGRAYERVVSDPSCPDAETAAARAQDLLDVLSDRSAYVATFTTRVDRCEPGQTGSITLAEQAMSGVHLVQAVTATYTPSIEPWRFALTVTNSLRPRAAGTPDAYWASVQGAA